jgi:D-sedoheptulose 7-phosphate isomerase
MRIAKATRLLVDTLNHGNKILICGNGGSAAQADHFAAELIGSGYPCIPLTNASVITAIANDLGYDRVFSRQVVAYASEGDALIVLTTSGLSENAIRAARYTVSHSITTIALTGENDELFGECNVSIPFEGNTQMVQEQHIVALHKLWEGICENRR